MPNIILPITNALVKYGATSKYGAELPMTALGITMKINQIITGIVIGIAVGSQPIIGYNYGAGKMDRARKIYFLAVGCAPWLWPWARGCSSCVSASFSQP